MQVRDLRNSEIKDINRCEWRWHWGWNEQLTPVRTNTKLWMGIGVHEALAAWYLKGKKRGPHPAETWQKFCYDNNDSDRSVPQPAWEDEEIEWQDAVDLGIYMLEQYVNKYGKDSKMEFIATEQDFQMLILTPKQYRQAMRRKNIVRLVGTIDGVYRDLETGEIWLIEHKTSAVGGVPRFMKMLPVDKQTNTYYMAATYRLRKEGLLKPNQNISGIMFNWLEKYKPKEDDRDFQIIDGVVTFLNKDGTISKRQPKDPASYFKREPAFRSNGDLKNIYEEIQHVGVKRENLLRGVSPLTKNPTMDCSWDCNFFKLCQLHSSGDDWEEYKEMAFHTNEDRYAAHNNRKKA